MSLRDPENESHLQNALQKLAAREQLTDEERTLINNACVDDYNQPIIEWRLETNRKHANNEPLTIREKAWVDLLDWQNRCLDTAFLKFITQKD